MVWFAEQSQQQSYHWRRSTTFIKWAYEFHGENKGTANSDRCPCTMSSRAFTVWAFKTVKLPVDSNHDGNAEPVFANVCKYLVPMLIAQFPPRHDLRVTKQGYARPPKPH